MKCLKGTTSMVDSDSSDSDVEPACKKRKLLSNRLSIKSRGSDLKGSFIGVSGHIFRHLMRMKMPKWFFPHLCCRARLPDSKQVSA